MNIFKLSECPVESVLMMCAGHLNGKMIVESCQLLATAKRLIDGRKVKIRGYVKPDRSVKIYKKPSIKHVLPGEEVIDGILRPVTYMEAHNNHPSSIWTRQCSGNYEWLVDHCNALIEAYSDLHGKQHKSSIEMQYLSELPENIKIETTKPLLLATSGIDLGNDVLSYRAYYANKISDWLSTGTAKKLKDSAFPYGQPEFIGL